MVENLKVEFATTDLNKSDATAYPLPMRSEDEVIAETIVACVLIISGLIGNGIVCYTIHRSRSTKSSMYYFMVHLAYADLLVCCVSIPLTLLSTRPQPFLKSLDPAPCKMIRFIQYILPPASVAILAATSVDRYYSICHPLKFTITTKRTNVIAAGCWIFAFLLTLPIFYLIETREVTYKNTVSSYCAIKETSTYRSSGKIYLIFRGIVGFLAPLLLIIVMYYKVMKTVWQRNSKKDSFSAIHNQKLNVVKTLVLVVIAFNLSWAPFSITNKYFLMLEKDFDKIRRVEIITFWIGLSTSVYNPFIYAFYNKNFREALKEVIFKRSSRTRKESSGVTPPARLRGASLPDLNDLTNLHSVPREASSGFRGRAQTYDCQWARDRVSENVIGYKATRFRERRNYYSKQDYANPSHVAANAIEKLKAKESHIVEMCDEVDSQPNMDRIKFTETQTAAPEHIRKSMRMKSTRFSSAGNLPRIDL